MGKKALDIVELNVQELIEELNKAYADEWLAFYQYWYAAKMATGINAKNVIDELEEHAKEELDHAEKLADRIITLGGVPVSNLKDFESRANCKYMEPKDGKDLEKLVLDAIAGERCAIDVYNGILKKVAGKDTVTYHIISHILEDEIKHEEDFENLLGL